ncbi:hypothetical protein [Brevibacillus brevis]|uniref:hypothetical protein n=1 Tax=Brevibacillus brevis TaxID=1393 RepID=UPI001EE1F8E6|nr:hypothetical protein [Brevibacillus brevis]
MNTILVVTNSRDLTVDYMINKYGSSVGFFRLNVDLLHSYNITFSNRGHFFEISGEYGTLSSHQVSAVYYRKPILPNLDDYEQRFRNLMHRDIMTLIEGITETVGVRCLSRPSILRRADNKIVQLQLAQEIGFHLPASLVTNSARAAKEICKEEKSIVKPLSLGRIIHENTVGIIQTNLVDSKKDFLGLELSPAYFQHYMKKDTEVRATIVGREVFAVSIDSTDPIDWRKPEARHKYDLIELPEKVTKQCFAMMDTLGLSFGAFDFIIREGQYVFLEVNANGQWLWLEEALSLNISNAIINYLTGK